MLEEVRARQRPVRGAARHESTEPAAVRGFVLCEVRDPCNQDVSVAKLTKDKDQGLHTHLRVFARWRQEGAESAKCRAHSAGSDAHLVNGFRVFRGNDQLLAAPKGF
jgi:hypothetical protein